MIHLRKGSELDGIRKAARLAADILQRTAKLVKPGVSTGVVDAAAAEFMKDEDCVSAFLGYRGFPGNICISLNEEVVHGIGSPTRLIQNGDIVKIDVGIVKDGWVGDNALTVPVGMIAPEVHQLLRATEDSLEIAISHARDGGMLRELCGSVEKSVRRYGYTVVKEFVGHGVGKDLHEEPQVPNYASKEVKKIRLKAGMVLAIEPMVNMGTAKVQVLDDDWTVITRDQAPSAHYEHMVLVTKGEPEVLTSRDRLTSPLEESLVEKGA